eukprot:TRINITY_DN16314_c0_g1_i1.p1 TRINITY_DN16314_c0_g1~~TRINITY_DN16314_c0_g1_i1.p1  ORF type:complete len:281 (+),score=53.13 TRINITY_DN16314_c0_g1_i1:324-1166(+)
MARAPMLEIMENEDKIIYVDRFFVGSNVKVIDEMEVNYFGRVGIVKSNEAGLQYNGNRIVVYFPKYKQQSHEFEVNQLEKITSYSKLIVEEQENEEKEYQDDDEKHRIAQFQSNMKQRNCTQNNRVYKNMDKGKVNMVLPIILNQELTKMLKTNKINHLNVECIANLKETFNSLHINDYDEDPKLYHLVTPSYCALISFSMKASFNNKDKVSIAIYSYFEKWQSENDNYNDDLVNISKKWIELNAILNLTQSFQRLVNDFYFLFFVFVFLNLVKKKKKKT